MNSESHELIDTHCHLNDSNLAWSVEEAIGRAEQAGVRQLVVPGLDVATSERAVELAGQYPKRVFAAVGIHPHEVVKKDFELKNAIQALRNLLLHHCKPAFNRSSSGNAAINHKSCNMVAIGEVGIDYHHHTQEETGVRQREAFGQFLKLATEHNLPVIIHGREAYNDVLAIAAGYPQVRAVLHSFEAPYEIAAQALDRGWLISLTALITYPNYDWLREVVAKLPLERLMVETDAPYLPPQRVRAQKPTLTPPGKLGRRGLNNEPANVVDVAQALAKVQQLTLEEIAVATTKNTRAFFGI
ncbi:TatD family hydrolase [Candidatus Berkelbacteria bacterium]|nr:TatD family hydrolase [Candidatus Berkelbacteria bacterium]